MSECMFLVLKDCTIGSCQTFLFANARRTAI
uniref:Uncharacterized protein n=1 Tax=Anguilla anguilla TaxID=7936 RepID=A0A0E9WIH6_ANGAN